MKVCSCDGDTHKTCNEISIRLIYIIKTWHLKIQKTDHHLKCNEISICSLLFNLPIKIQHHKTQQKEGEPAFQQGSGGTSNKTQNRSEE